MRFFGRSRGKSEADKFAVEMGWRYVAYREGAEVVALQIEPMVQGPDVVYVPDDVSWIKAAPRWARDRRSEILERLRSASWNRRVEWRPVATSFVELGAIAGSLESTPGGQQLEQARLFHPGAPLTAEQARIVWHEAVRSFVAQVQGKVTVIASELIPDSVFASIELPALKANPNVQLDLR